MNSIPNNFFLIMVLVFCVLNTGLQLIVFQYFPDYLFFTLPALSGLTVFVCLVIFNRVNKRKLTL
ncbi:hypothetical protein EYS14_19915 [Alteromonadaceae bacterium M269]|nr:hypothetical protein EYS14_19915 [Alteromonadaceae bacterium M269]